MGVTFLCALFGFNCLWCMLCDVPMSILTWQSPVSGMRCLTGTLRGQRGRTHGHVYHERRDAIPGKDTQRRRLPDMVDMRPPLFVGRQGERARDFTPGQGPLWLGWRDGGPLRHPQACVPAPPAHPCVRSRAAPYKSRPSRHSTLSTNGLTTHTQGARGLRECSRPSCVLHWFRS